MITLQQQTEQRLMSYVSNFGGNYDNMITNILSYRISQLQKTVKSIKIDLQYFEKKYEMPTSVFYEKFETGKLGDKNSDYYQWSGEYETFLDYQKELKYLL